MLWLDTRQRGKGAISTPSAELESVQNYLTDSVWLDGLGAQEVGESLAEEMTN